MAGLKKSYAAPLFQGEGDYATVLLTQSNSRSIASVALFAILVTSTPADAQVYGPGSAEATSLDQGREAAGSYTNSEPIKLAHCGSCDLGAVQLMESPAKPKGAGVLSDSLWGNLILAMVYQRDKELQKLSKRQSLANVFTLGTVGAVSGLSLAQSIVTLNTLKESPGHHHSDGGGESGEDSGMPGETGHGQNHSPVPGILGLVASGSTIAALVTQIFWNHHYRKKITARQLALKSRIDDIIAHLDAGANCMDCQKELTEMIGKKATKEFLHLWQSTHTLAVVPKASG